MLPVSLDLARLPIVLVGAGAAGLRRLDGLDEAGAARLRVFTPAPTEEWQAAAGARLIRAWPGPLEFRGAAIVFLAGLDPDATAQLAAQAREAGALVHAEDRLDLTDLHLPAIVRRGDLTLAVSTGGQSPALARRIKRFLGRLFGPEWEGRVRQAGTRRSAWRQAGLAPAEISARTEALVDDQGWLRPARPRLSALLDENRATAQNR